MLARLVHVRHRDRYTVIIVPLDVSREIELERDVDSGGDILLLQFLTVRHGHVAGCLITHRCADFEVDPGVAEEVIAETGADRISLVDVLGFICREVEVHEGQNG